jgi:hypothetical protein
MAAGPKLVATMLNTEQKPAALSLLKTLSRRFRGGCARYKVGSHCCHLMLRSTADTLRCDDRSFLRSF